MFSTFTFCAHGLAGVTPYIPTNCGNEQCFREKHSEPRLGIEARTAVHYLRNIKLVSYLSLRRHHRSVSRSSPHNARTQTHRHTHTQTHARTHGRAHYLQRMFCLA